jgi:hypothetical protein
MNKLEQAAIIQQQVEEMSDEAKEHFSDLILRLSLCYGKNPARALVLMQLENASTVSVTTVNCTDIEAGSMLLRADEFFNYLNLRDAPPKEMFN